jgi:hypothetical protein
MKKALEKIEEHRNVPEKKIKSIKQRMAVVAKKVAKLNK